MDPQTAAPYAVLLDLLGVALIVLAGAGLTVLAFLTDWKLGAAALCLPIGWAGWALATRDQKQQVV